MRGIAVSKSVSEEQFRDVMRRVATPVVVVTAVDPAGEVRGITIGSFTSLSLEPPLICFNVMEQARMHGIIQEADAFTVHILRSDQVALSTHFALPDLSGEEQFRPIPHTLRGDGIPVLDDALAIMHCAMHERVPAGDHSIIIGRVEETKICSPGDPLLYYDRGYRHVGEEVQPSLLSPVKRASNGTS